MEDMRCPSRHVVLDGLDGHSKYGHGNSGYPLS